MTSHENTANQSAALRSGPWITWRPSAVAAASIGQMNRIDIAGVGIEVAHLPGPADRAPLVFLHEGLGSVSMWRQRGRHWPAELCAATGRAGWMYSRRGYGQSDPVADVRGAPRTKRAMAHRAPRTRLHAPRGQRGAAASCLTHWASRARCWWGTPTAPPSRCSMPARHAVAACVAMAPHVFVEDMSLTAIAQAKHQYLADPGSAGSLRQRLARHHRNVDNAFWQWNDVWLSEAFRAFDIREEMRSITAPLLLVQGVDDEYGSMEQISSIETAHAQITRLALVRCGHSPHRDQPDRLTEAVRALPDTARLTASSQIPPLWDVPKASIGVPTNGFRIQRPVCRSRNEH